MTEADSGAELDQPVGLGRRLGLRPDPEMFGDAPQQGRVAHRLGRRREQQPLGLLRE